MSKTNKYIFIDIIIKYKRIFTKFKSLENEHWAIPFSEKLSFLWRLRKKLRPLLDMSEDQDDDDISFEIDPDIRGKGFDECILVYYSNSNEITDAPRFQIATLYVSYICNTTDIRYRGKEDAIRD